MYCMISDKQLARIHFVTGKLAEPMLREIVAALAAQHHFQYTIDVLPITVAALMTPKWLLKHMSVPKDATCVILPGYLQNGLHEIQATQTIPVHCGPKDILDLPTLFGKSRYRGSDYGQYSIEVIAEINYAPRLTLDALEQEATRLRDSGADRIDLGCEPGQRWHQIGVAVRRLCDLGLTVSVDTFEPWEASEGAKNGATLVLSVNRTNREAATDWGCEVVVVPDDLNDFVPGLLATTEHLQQHDVPFRLDPILEPIGCGFARSLGRYLETRRLFPDAQMMMGIGNLTELTDCDSAAINTLLLGFCEEQQIGSVLTTQVIPWAQSSVRECDLARRLVHYAVQHKAPPKHLEERLVILRDPAPGHFSAQAIAILANSIKDNNYRILIDGERIHLISAGVHIVGTDPFAMIDELLRLPQSRNVNETHAFYLGFELSKALTALTLGKRYVQDEALRWGMHTRDEQHRRLARTRRTSPQPDQEPTE
jgi:dihydropteroate synthase